MASAARKQLSGLKTLGHVQFWRLVALTLRSSGSPALDVPPPLGEAKDPTAALVCRATHFPPVGQRARSPQMSACSLPLPRDFSRPLLPKQLVQTQRARPGGEQVQENKAIEDGQLTAIKYRPKTPG